MRLALAALATVLLAAPAQAAGVQVTWPEARQYGPGEQIAVTVKADRKVKVSVLRVSASGKVMHSVVRRTLKRGSVTATLKRAGTYAVRVDRRQRMLKVAAAAGDPAPSPPNDCVAANSVQVEVRLGADRVARGQSLPYAIVNTSGTCILTGAAYALEHQQADGSWAPAPWQLIFPLYAVIVPAGGEFAKQVPVPADAPLGMYRLIETGGFTEPTFEVVA